MNTLFKTPLGFDIMYLLLQLSIATLLSFLVPSLVVGSNLFLIFFTFAFALICKVNLSKTFKNVASFYLGIFYFFIIFLLDCLRYFRDRTISIERIESLSNVQLPDFIYFILGLGDNIFSALFLCAVSYFFMFLGNYAAQWFMKNTKITQL